MGSSDRADTFAKIQNTQLATGIHRLVQVQVQKNNTLPVLPKKLTETQEKSALFSRRGVLSLKSKIVRCNIYILLYNILYCRRSLCKRASYCQKCVYLHLESLWEKLDYYIFPLQERVFQDSETNK